MRTLKTKTRQQDESSPRKRGLIGKFFHSYHAETGDMEWQGRILSRPSKDVYLVQLFEWLLGTPSDQVLVPLTQMVAEHWTFYSDRDEWLCAHEEYERRREMKERLRATSTTAA